MTSYSPTRFAHGLLAFIEHAYAAGNWERRHLSSVRSAFLGILARFWGCFPG
jgi:hypothetical protein